METKSKAKTPQMYALGRDRILVKTSSPLLEGWEVCDNLETLRSVVGHSCDDSRAVGIRWRGAKLPAELVQKILGTIAQFPHMETGYVLAYSRSEGKWDVVCPGQQGRGASVVLQAQRDDLKPGYVEIGTVHTHPGMAAKWSSTDMRDQAGKYGVHCVLGLKDGKVAQYLWTIFTPLGQYDLQWDDIAEPVDFDQEYAPDDAWVTRIKAAADKKPKTGDRPKMDPRVWGTVDKHRDYSADELLRKERHDAYAARNQQDGYDRFGDNREDLAVKLLNASLVQMAYSGLDVERVLDQSCASDFMDYAQEKAEYEDICGYMEVCPDDDWSMEDLHDELETRRDDSDPGRWCLVDVAGPTTAADLCYALRAAIKAASATPDVMQRLRAELAEVLGELGLVPKERANA